MTSSNSVLTVNLGFALLFLLEVHPPAAAESTGQIITATPHMCVVIAPSEIRPEFGCFRIGIAKDLKLKRATIYWDLYAFPSRAAADTARSPTGIVVEKNERVWLSELGSRNRRLRGGHRIAVVGPLKLLPAESYTAEIAYSVMQPDDRSRVHTHSACSCGPCLIAYSTGRSPWCHRPPPMSPLDARPSFGNDPFPESESSTSTA